MRIRKIGKNEIFSVIDALTLALEARDPYTFGHSQRVAEISARIAETLGLGSGYVDAIRLAVRLHDVGKIGIPDAILLREGPLPDEDFRVIQRHPVIGGDMIRKINSLDFTLPLVRHHHERFDGRGYPDGLSGDRIPLGARIIAVADALDAMLSDRPYRKAMEVQDAAGELQTHAGNHFDPKIVAKLGNLGPVIRGLNFQVYGRANIRFDDHDTVRHSLRGGRARRFKKET